MWTNDPFTNYQGDREPLLNSFCEYQESINPKSDSDASHWDVALLVSGLNFYAVDSRGRKVFSFLLWNPNNKIFSVSRTE